MDEAGTGRGRGVSVLVAVTFVALVVASVVLWRAREDDARTAAFAPSSTRSDAGDPDCGEPVAKPDGSPWTCTFADDFDGTALDRDRWVPQADFASGGDPDRACAVDDPDDVAVADGTLRLTVREADEPTTCQGEAVTHTGASISTYHLFSQEYGRFEARMRVTRTDAPGLQEAFWLWPDDRVPSQQATWPAAGEIDVAETSSLLPDLAVPYLHYTAWDNGGPQPGVNTAYDCRAPRGGWHTYTLVWTPKMLIVRVDGRSCLVNLSDDPAFDQPYVLALSAALGSGENAYTGRAPMPATTEVDYVRVWD